MIERYIELRRIIFEAGDVAWHIALSKDDLEEFDALRRLIPVDFRLEALALLRIGDSTEEILRKMAQPEDVRNSKYVQLSMEYARKRQAYVASRKIRRTDEHDVRADDSSGSGRTDDD